MEREAETRRDAEFLHGLINHASAMVGEVEPSLIIDRTRAIILEYRFELAKKVVDVRPEFRYAENKEELT